MTNGKPDTVESLTNELDIISSRKEWIEKIKAFGDTKEEPLYQIIGKDYMRKYSPKQEMMPDIDDPFVIPNYIPDIYDLSPMEWSKWIQLTKWNYEGRHQKHNPASAKEWVTGIGRSNGKPITHQRLLKTFTWKELEEEENVFRLGLARGTVNEFIRYLRNGGK